MLIRGSVARRFSWAGSIFDGNRGRSDQTGSSRSDQTAKAVHLNVRGIEMLSGRIPADLQLCPSHRIMRSGLSDGENLKGPA